MIISGALLPILSVIPGQDPEYLSKGYVEDIKNTFFMMGGNGLIIGILILYIISSFFYNWAGMMIIAEASTVIRSIFDAVKTALIWVADLLIAYVFIK